MNVEYVNWVQWPCFHMRNGGGRGGGGKRQCVSHSLGSPSVHDQWVKEEGTNKTLMDAKARNEKKGRKRKRQRQRDGGLVSMLPQEEEEENEEWS